MKRLAVLGSILAAALMTVDCANPQSSIVGPTAVTPSGTSATDARGGGGGGGKGGGGGNKPSSGTSTLELVMWDDVNGNGLPNYADTVTFNVSTTETDGPIVALDCYQDGTKVYWTQAAFYDGDPWPWTKYMKLESTYWTGGAASCIATLEYQTNKGNVALTSINFDVAP